ncbi:MAG: hypothetical protein KKG93_09940, partial [Bacteroidetes bacterium]|nr:hypothetical protein [Bacteroidota bacterium]
KKNSLNCRIMEGGILKPKKGMNLPGMKLSTQAVTKKDFENLEFALKPSAVNRKLEKGK